MPEAGPAEVLLVPDGAVSGNPGPGRLGRRSCVKRRAPAASSPAASRTPPTTAWSCVRVIEGLQGAEAAVPRARAVRLGLRRRTRTARAG